MKYDKVIGENRIARINVEYSRGDYNGKRGIVVNFDNIELLRRDGGFVIEKYCPIDGLRVYCEAMKRANAKILKKWTDGVGRFKDTLFDYWAQENRDAICNILASI